MWQNPPICALAYACIVRISNSRMSIMSRSQRISSLSGSSSVSGLTGREDASVGVVTVVMSASGAMADSSSLPGAV